MAGLTISPADEGALQHDDDVRDRGNDVTGLFTVHIIWNRGPIVPVTRVRVMTGWCESDRN